jgi:hypothetical protein
MNSAGLNRDAVSLIVGVTGHRDVVPSDEEALRAAFARILDDIRRDAPSTPLALLCGMAGGADTIAAEVALARGVPVIACLPAPIDGYELDFPPDERTALRARLGRCAAVVTLPSSADADAGYRAVGNYLLTFSHVLVAFWDGVASERPGGTSDVVRGRLEGTQTTQLRAPFEPPAPDVGPVVQIVTPRAGAGRSPDSLATIMHFPPRRRGDDRSRSDFEEALRQFDAYNCELALQRRRAPADPSLAALQTWTDAAANRLQRISLRYLNLLYFLGLCVAVVSVLADAVTRFVTILATYFAYAAHRNSSAQARYQDYRAVSEALRVQQAWNDAALGESLVDSAYLRMQQSELMWIRMALRSVTLIFCRLGGSPRSENVADYRRWVDGQIAFFAKAARRNDAINRSLHRSGLIATIAGALAGGALLALANLGKIAAPGSPGPLRALAGGLASSAAGAYAAGHQAGLVSWGTALLTLGGVYYALIATYSQNRAFEMNAKRYQRMHFLFDDARQRLDEIGAGAPGSRRHVVFELGREALVEQADWLLTRRDQPLSLIPGAEVVSALKAPRPQRRPPKVPVR